MSQVARKKQIGMYTFTLDEDGALTIQSPALLKPMTIAAKQAQDLTRWLAEVQELEIPSTAPAEVPTHTPLIATDAAMPVPLENQPVQTTEESPTELAQRITQKQVALAREAYPESLKLLNRDRLIEQIARSPEIRPLMSQGKVSRKQIMLWMNQAIEEQ